jgi:hypothetical protein
MQATSCVLSPTIEQSAPHFLEKLLTGALFTLTVVVTVACAPVHSAEVPHVNSKSLPPQNQPSQGALPDGTYLYGESVTPNQAGTTYMVIDVRDRQVVGAFYAPSSSFDCFRGKFQANNLALNIADSYDRTSHLYSVPLQANTQVAPAGQSASAPVELTGYHQIQTISAADQKLLATCQAKYSAIGRNKR